MQLEIKHVKGYLDCGMKIIHNAKERVFSTSLGISNAYLLFNGSNIYD